MENGKWRVERGKWKEKRGEDGVRIKTDFMENLLQCKKIGLPII